MTAHSPTFQPHALRHILHQELHARPSIVVTSPATIRSWAFFLEPEQHEAAALHWQQLLDHQRHLLLEEAPGQQALVQIGTLRLKWERHIEFISLTLYAEGNHSTAHLLAELPPRWLATIPGALIAAAAIDVQPITDTPPDDFLAQIDPLGPATVASKIADGTGYLFTDFQLHDGMTHFTIIDGAILPRQLGRIVQRLIEIETYRMLALLAFPAARRLQVDLALWEKRLAEVMHDLESAQTIAAERHLLTRLTQLSAEVERSVANSNFRFSAAAAYYRLVQQRAEDLREGRLTGYSTLKGFLERRLAPAMNTCATVYRRQEELSARIARNSQLLRTRVDLKLQEQNQQILDQMNRRARLQLRLQEAAEHFSVVAISYYGAQIIHTLAKGIAPWIAPLTPELMAAMALPLVALLAFLSIRRLRKRLHVSFPDTPQEPSPHG
ncbi:MAG: DUF3422 domain-containing protein [Hydrogenophilus sp.]|nr:DUF3422 domain-containing protein [Hydrogenophilus sp.]